MKPRMRTYEKARLTEFRDDSKAECLSCQPKTYLVRWVCSQVTGETPGSSGAVGALRGRMPQWTGALAQATHGVQAPLITFD
jgi:hypothetical protein